MTDSLYFKHKACTAKLIALGSNMSSSYGTPLETLQYAYTQIKKHRITIIKTYPIIKTKPYGVTNQNDFYNTVIHIQTSRSPFSLLKILHRIEKQCGRKRDKIWSARTLDLDLISYHNYVSSNAKYFHRSTKISQSMIIKKQSQTGCNLPHYDLHNRIFVLRPIKGLIDFWHHPLYKTSIQSMLNSVRKKRNIKP